MRIVGGQFKGRRFSPPSKNWKTRPTTDFAKEGLYNILTNLINFKEAKMLDLFGGTGNHSYEFCSRGCTDVTYIEKYHGCVTFVKKIAADLDIEDNISIHRQDVFKYLKTTDEQFSFIFADPPYDHKSLADLPRIISESNLLLEDGIFVLEHDRRHSFKDTPTFWQERIYGNVHFSFFR
jgi:16S rRNA (guanine(966)-N(2))-methyltransferase RsmD